MSGSRLSQSVTVEEDNCCGCNILAIRRHFLDRDLKQVHIVYTSCHDAVSNPPSGRYTLVCVSALFHSPIEERCCGGVSHQPAHFCVTFCCKEDGTPVPFNVYVMQKQCFDKMVWSLSLRLHLWLHYMYNVDVEWELLSSYLKLLICRCSQHLKQSWVIPSLYELLNILYFTHTSQRFICPHGKRQTFYALSAATVLNTLRLL